MYMVCGRVFYRITLATNYLYELEKRNSLFWYSRLTTFVHTQVITRICFSLEPLRLDWMTLALAVVGPQQLLNLHLFIAIHAAPLLLPSVAGTLHKHYTI